MERKKPEYNVVVHDMERIIEVHGREEDDVVREHYRVLLRLVMAKNPQFIETIERGDIMTDDELDDVLMKLVKKKVDAKVNDKEQQTLVSSIRNIMESFGVTIEKAMDSLKIPQSQRSMYAGLVGKQMH